MHFNAKWLKNRQELAKIGKNRQKIRAPPIRECPYTLLYIYRTFASFAPHALKGQKLLAQGIALGYYGR